MTADASTGPLFTDLYELTMAAGYHASGVTGEATFSVYIRSNPARNYYIAAGLRDVVTALSGFRFSAGDLHYLSETGRFTRAFIDVLADLSFTGAVVAIPEGTVFFSEEPILEITAPIIQAQLVETRILNCLGLPTLIATKAARCVHAAAGRPLIDFSLRRTQGIDAGMTVARSAYLAGFSATSNVLAGKRYGIPLSGTMAHSFVMAFPSEAEAFTAYAKAFPESTVLLVDTYDVEKGTRNAIQIASALKKKGTALLGVRLDSGNLADQSVRVRRLLDDAGFSDVKIFASSSLDEFAIDDLINRGARIDAFGVGTRMGVSADRPYLDIVYKLVSIDGRGVRKHSFGKATMAGAKQVFRRLDAQGLMCEDIIGGRSEALGGTPLMVPVMADGRSVRPNESLDAIRNRAAAGLSALPAAYRALHAPAQFPVSFSSGLTARQP